MNVNKRLYSIAEAATYLGRTPWEVRKCSASRGSRHYGRTEGFTTTSELWIVVAQLWRKSERLAHPFLDTNSSEQSGRASRSLVPVFLKSLQSGPSLPDQQREKQ